MHENLPARIGRRQFLRASGVCVALPALESLAGAAPAQAAAGAAAGDAAAAPLRMAFLSIPNGVQQDAWYPTGAGADFQLSPTLAPLESVKDQLRVFVGLEHENATPGEDGPGDHARANATYLTGARARKTPGRDIHCGVSVDQVAAQATRGATRFASLELSCDAVRNSGACDSGYACAYQYNLSWSSPTTPVTPEPNPRLVFERLFGSGGPEERRHNFLVRREQQRSVLDFVLDDTRRLHRRSSGLDRRKLDEYLTAVRDLETRLSRSGDDDAPPEVRFEPPEGVPGDFGAHMDAMYDLLTLALQTDSTRVATLLLSSDGSNRAFPQIGVDEGHHVLSHNQHDAAVRDKIAKIDRFYAERFAQFLKRLADTPDTDGATLLDNTLVVYGGALSDGNRHTHDRLPAVVAGGAGRLGVVERLGGPGRIDVPEQPMTNLFVSMLDEFGVPTERFGDSTGPLRGIG
ncbi:DUF1552 domain-containing protein [Botrimarina sp.]|uniref:DUF1552 domain-containing protein n=1 Tax=Botrimarina sp. TaxID=2795802 RepID=UPI0032EAA264